ncbi:hypothetical protein B0H11DRAFT_2294406 [Mycena galericulata]|nr:hypothetical protein B0H11DRAFT_2294406 [Mycena galericulata]
MGGLTITETIIEYAPVALNLLGKMIQWLNEDSALKAAYDSRTSQSPGSRETMRRGQLVSVKSKLQDDGDMQNLLDGLSGAVRSAFQEEYTYAYNGGDSLPPNAQKDQNGNPIKLVPGEDFTSCAANSAASISNYIDTNIITSNVPTWAQAQLRNELIGYLTQLLSTGETNAWVSSPQPKTITGGANNETLQADIILMYCTTDAPDPKNQGKNIKTLFCKYIGVYYLGTSWGLQSQAQAPPVQVGLPGSLKILALGASISSVILSTALGAHIIRTQPANVNTVVTLGPASLSVTVANKGATNGTGLSDASTDSDIPIAWLISILTDNGIPTYNLQNRLATANEYQEFSYLDDWENVAAFKKGDFSSLQY